MSKRIAEICVLILLSASLPGRGSAEVDWVEFAPPDRGFSVVLPAKPGPEQVSPAGGAMTSIWVLDSDGVRYAIGITDYKVIPSAEAEIDASMQNFLNAVKSSVVTQRSLSIAAPGGAPLPGIEFTHRGERLAGAGKIVVDGNRTYMWVITHLRETDAGARTQRFMTSIKVKGVRVQ